MSQARKYSEYVRECLRQAERADSSERREKLIELARIWMNAARVEDEAAGRTARSAATEKPPKNPRTGRVELRAYGKAPALVTSTKVTTTPSTTLLRPR